MNDDGADRGFDQGSATEAHSSGAADGGAGERPAASAEGVADANPDEELVPIGRVRSLQSANDKLRARIGELEGRVATVDEAMAAIRSDAEQVRTESLAFLRRALLAEHAGRVVPELVAGDSPEALVASVEVARAAFERAAEAARAQVGAQVVPAGTPARSRTAAEPLTPLDKIAEGLKRE